MVATSLSRAVSTRRAAAFVVAVSAVAAAGCTPEPQVGSYLASYAPYGTNGVDTTLIFPREQGAFPLLLRNWSPPGSPQEDSISIRGSSARLRFFTVADRPPTLVAEARPYSHPDARRQRLNLIVNGTKVTSVEMAPRWERYELELPAEIVKVGWNELDLAVASSLQSSHFDPKGNDGRTLAAQFRRLEMRGASGRPSWPDRVEEVRLVGAEARGTRPVGFGESALIPDTETDLADLGIEMPTDSLFEVYVGPSDDTMIVGDFGATFREPVDDGRIRVVAEVLEPDRTTRIWETALSPSGRTTGHLSADLSGWAGEPVKLRIRVFGDTNGVVRWKGLGTTKSAAGADAALDPARLASPPRSADFDRPDIFVILLDAARADAFDGSRGDDLTPNVARLAAEGTRFTQAWAPSAWTGQTIPAIFTGMAPDAVGIENWASRLPPSVVGFQEILQDNGYRTALWSQHNDVYSARLRRGFEVFEKVDATDVSKRELLPAVDSLLASGYPTFAFIHLLPPHSPYSPPPPFGGARSGWYDDELPITAGLLHSFEEPVSQQEDVRERVRRAAIAKYEENCQFADHLVGRFVADLKRAGRYGEAMIIVLADHGEAFDEHDRFLHTRFLFEEIVHVPLIIKWPRGFDDFVRRVDAPVSLLDVAPTIIDALGIADERALYQGRTLMPLVRGGAAPNRLIYAYTSGEPNPEEAQKPSYALRWGDMKLIWDASAEQASLYQLASDPFEQDNLARRMPFYTGMLTQFLKMALARNTRLLLANGGAQVGELDEDTIRSLQALGYLR